MEKCRGEKAQKMNQKAKACRWKRELAESDESRESRIRGRQAKEQLWERGRKECAYFKNGSRGKGGRSDGGKWRRNKREVKSERLRWRGPHGELAFRLGMIAKASSRASG